jgi:hypothetical protein
MPRDTLENLLTTIAVAKKIMTLGPITTPVPLAPSGPGVIHVRNELRDGSHADSPSGEAVFLS